MKSVFRGAGGSAGGWNGSLGVNHVVKQITESGEVIQRHRNPGPHYFLLDALPYKHIGGYRSGVGESQSGEVAVWMKEESAITKRFWHVVRIKNLLLGLVRR